MVVNRMGGAVYRSTDAGTTWASLSIPGSGRFCPPTRLDDGTLLVYRAGSGTLYRSSDTGLTWEAVTLDHTPDAIVAFSQQRIVAFTTPFNGPRFFRVSNDGGASFGPAQADSFQLPKAVVYFNATTAVVATGSAAHWRTTDSGQSWTMVNLGGQIQNLIRLSATEALAVGDWRITRTSDAGLTWSTVKNLPSGPIIHAVVHVGGDTVLLLHQHGAVRSTDRGGVGRRRT